VSLGRDNSRVVGNTEAIAKLGPLTSHADYAAGRISSNLKGSTKQFGWLQASQKVENTDDICLRQAGLIGAVQGLCLPFRGFSRSGNNDLDRLAPGNQPKTRRTF
jgi:hypothetical protein